MKYASFVDPITSITNETPHSQHGFLIVDSSVSGELTIQKEGTAVEQRLVLKASELQLSTKYIVFYSPLKGLVLVNHDEMFKSKDQWPYRSVTEVLSSPVANLYVHDDWDSSLFFSNIPPISDETYINVDYDTYIHDWIALQYPEGEYSVGHNTNVRLDAFRDVSTIDSIVALEQQVDLLQKLVCSLVKGDELEAWTNGFLDEIQTYSTTTLRSPVELTNDIKAHKKKIRQAQQSYFKNRR